jgi:hypothetical protein
MITVCVASYNYLVHLRLHVHASIRNYMFMRQCGFFFFVRVIQARAPLARPFSAPKFSRVFPSTHSLGFVQMRTPVYKTEGGQGFSSYSIKGIGYRRRIGCRRLYDA